MYAKGYIGFAGIQSYKYSAILFFSLEHPGSLGTPGGIPKSDFDIDINLISCFNILQRQVSCISSLHNFTHHARQ